MGLEACHKGDGNSKPGNAYDDWRNTYYEEDSKVTKTFKKCIVDLIYDNVYGTDSIGIITNGITNIWNYAKGINPGNDIPDNGKVWIDKHLCPYELWNDPERRKNGKFCKYTGTEENIEHFAIIINNRKLESTKIKKYLKCMHFS